jgi:hypothetical protein
VGELSALILPAVTTDDDDDDVDDVVDDYINDNRTMMTIKMEKISCNRTHNISLSHTS